MHVVKKVLILEEDLAQRFLIDITLLKNKVAPGNIVRKYMVLVVNYALSCKKEVNDCK